MHASVCVCERERKRQRERGGGGGGRKRTNGRRNFKDVRERQAERLCAYLFQISST